MMIFSLAIAHGQIDLAKLTGKRSLRFPAHAVLEESAHPVIASNGQVGFISSVTDGSVVSFSLASGKTLSLMSVGHTAGPVTLVESEGRRLLAAPAVNDPGSGHPVTISVIDVTDAKSIELHTLIALPPAAQITAATRAYLTRDLRFCIIASSFPDPALFSISLETGQMASWMPLLGRPSETAFYERGSRRAMAIVSSQSNELVLVGVDREGNLSFKASFNPLGASFAEANNPAFSLDGRVVYVAAAKGDKLFQVDAASGSLMASADVELPQQVSVTRDAYRRDLIGVTRIAGPSYSARGGVTTFIREDAGLSVKSEFSPPPSIEFSPANNVAFSRQGRAAFVATATGMLFAFDVENGELQSHLSLGSELRRLALNEKAGLVAVVRSSSRGDEVIISSFDVVESEESEESIPVINSLRPDRVEQGRVKNLSLTVLGENFLEGSTVLVNDQEVASDLVRNGRALQAKLRRSLFEQTGNIHIQVKAPSGAVSVPRDLSVVRPADPVIDRIKPREVPGPSKAFALRVTGANFRPSSTIQVGDRSLNTERVSSTELRAQVPADIAGIIGQVAVRVKDITVPDLVSNEMALTVFGPRIKELRTDVESVVAGTRSFNLRVIGQNFRDGAKVEIGGQGIPDSRVQKQNGNLIRVMVPSRFFQDAGEMPVVVRNADGNTSEPMTLNSLAPEITEFLPGRILAGLSDVKVELRGERFRKKLRVYVANSEGQAVNVGHQSVRFRSSTRIVVTLNGELNEMLKRQGTLRFQVVNPNKGDGIPSAEKTIDVVGPEIVEAAVRHIAEDDLNVRLVIRGANFRKEAMVEFVKDGAVVRRQEPEKIREDRLSLTIRARKLEALGDFRLVVVNPGRVRSNAEQPQQGQVTADIDQ